MRQIERDIVSALIFSKDNKLLMGKKDPQGRGVYFDCWHLPGGGADDGEDLIKALIRETIEEVGIDISKYKIKLVNDKDSDVSETTLRKTGERVLCAMNFNVYRVNIDDKNADQIKLKLEDDLIEVKWFDIAELKPLKLTPPSIKLFKKLNLI